MKTFILMLVLFSFSFSKQYVFMVNEYDKEIDLEAKIVSKIAHSSLKGHARLYIPSISKQERDIYKNYFELTQDCHSANFIFDKRGLRQENCIDENKLFFTNNYKRLVKNEKYFGAFFWNKGRPNIVFFKKRLQRNKIDLPDDFEQFIDDQ